MSYVRHHAIVVAGTARHVRIAHRAARVIFSHRPTAISKTGMNDVCSFMVGPDGSNEGWPESNIGDAQRALFIEWMRGASDRVYLNWAEVSFGDEYGPAKILAER